MNHATASSGQSVTRLAICRVTVPLQRNETSESRGMVHRSEMASLSNISLVTFLSMVVNSNAKDALNSNVTESQEMTFKRVMDPA